MIIVSTPKLSVNFPDRIKLGTPLTASESNCLNRILTARMRHHVKKWLNQGISPKEAQAQLAEAARFHEFSEKLNENFDPQTLEARRIAREIITSKLAKEGLMAQEATLEIHIQAVSKLPQVIERAKQIIDARRQVAREALGQ
jgi:tRNA(Ile)-lysidine synthase TilS/MesJ